jgi:hypothetical protein
MQAAEITAAESFSSIIRQGAEQKALLLAA